MFLGRDIASPVAMEGALKLKEITYLPADAYAAGEMKHGPIALIGEDTPSSSPPPARRCTTSSRRTWRRSPPAAPA